VGRDSVKEYVIRDRAADHHEQSIRQFLYDEGMSQADEIAEALKLGNERTREILRLMREAGVVVRDRRGNKTYWILSEDANGT
jgi:transcription initiation factor IIE alpha subunit